MPDGIILTPERFQFHFGSIGRPAPFAAEYALSCFNSTLVRLEVMFGLLTMLVVTCFNSTLVRLEGNMKPVLFFSLESFNSTLVRLEAGGTSYRMTVDNSFQFHFGSIGRKSMQFMQPSPSCVSIPLWFDWKLQNI